MGESLKDRLQADMMTAMKARDAERRDALRYLLSGVKNQEIDKRAPLTEAEEIAWLRSAAKQRRDSIEMFRQGGRDDLAQREESQLAVLETYLPQQMSDDELAAFVKSGIEEVGASSPKDMGKVMGLLNPRSEGRVDGKRLSTAVREALAG
jgi:uncharacterized protein YqeY